MCAADRVTLPRLELDDVRPEIGEPGARERAELKAAEVQNRIAVEWTGQRTPRQMAFANRMRASCARFLSAMRSLGSRATWAARAATREASSLGSQTMFRKPSASSAAAESGPAPSSIHLAFRGEMSWSQVSSNAASASGATSNEL